MAIFPIYQVRAAVRTRSIDVIFDNLFLCLQIMSSVVLSVILVKIPQVDIMYVTLKRYAAFD